MLGLEQCVKQYNVTMLEFLILFNTIYIYIYIYFCFEGLGVGVGVCFTIIHLSVTCIHFIYNTLIISVERTALRLTFTLFPILSL